MIITKYNINNYINYCFLTKFFYLFSYIYEKNTIPMYLSSKTHLIPRNKIIIIIFSNIKLKYNTSFIGLYLNNYQNTDHNVKSHK